MEKQMGLKECAKYDFEHGIAAIMTGWGIICRDRQVKGISRKCKRDKRKASWTEHLESKAIKIDS